MPVIGDIGEGKLFEDATKPKLKEVLTKKWGKISEAYNNLSDNFKESVKDLYKSTLKPIPENFNKYSDEKLRKLFKDSNNIFDKIIYIRVIASRMRVNPIQLIAVLIAIGLLVVPTGALAVGVGIAEKNKNVRGASIDRHRNAMKQFNIKNNTSLYAMHQGQL